MLNPDRFRDCSISHTCPTGFLSAALLLLLFAMVKAEEANNINFQLHETIRSGENKQDGSPDCLAGLDVIFPGYYPDSLPVGLPENRTTVTTTANPIDADGASTPAKKKSATGYPVDWSAVAELYYRSVDGGSRKSPALSSS